MTKLQIRKTNRVVPESPFLTACKERDGLLGNIEMNHYTNVDDIVNDHRKFYVSPGENIKRLSLGGWVEIADELNKPGVFDKLARHFRRDV